MLGRNQWCKHYRGMHKKETCEAGEGPGLATLWSSRTARWNKAPGSLFETLSKAEL